MKYIYIYIYHYIRIPSNKIVVRKSMEGKTVAGGTLEGYTVEGKTVAGGTLEDNPLEGCKPVYVYTRPKSPLIDWTLTPFNKVENTATETFVALKKDLPDDFKFTHCAIVKQMGILYIHRIIEFQQISGVPAQRVCTYDVFAWSDNELQYPNGSLHTKYDCTYEKLLACAEGIDDSDDNDPIGWLFSN